MSKRLTLSPFSPISRVLRARKRPVSLTDLQRDIVVSVMAKVELKRHLMDQAKSDMKFTLTGLSPEEGGGGVCSRHKFSKAPGRVKIEGRRVRKKEGGTQSAKTSPVRMRADSCVSVKREPEGPTEMKKWVSPFDCRDVRVLPKGLPSPNLTLVARRFPSQSRSSRTSPAPTRRTSPISDSTQTTSRQFLTVLFPTHVPETTAKHLEALGRQLTMQRIKG